ncbi:MAG: NAD-dependent epimerase/dehydratase family protein [Methanoregula sp.]
MLFQEKKTDLKKIREKTILITGGTGFIGNHLVHELLHSCNVLVISRQKKIPHITTVNADITDISVLQNSLKKIDIDLVFHMAGSTNSPHHTKDPNFFSINAIGTKNVLELCRQKNIEQMVYSSTMEVFGDPLYTPVDEKHPKLPNTNYGVSKWMGEEYCRQYLSAYGICSTILRYSYVYGPGLPPYRVISRFIKNALDNKPLLLNNEGKDINDYIYVGDIVSANILAVTHAKAKNNNFNIGSGTPTSVVDLANTVIKLIGKGKTETISGMIQPAKNFVFNISKAQNLMKYNPVYSLSAGIKEQINDIIT